MNTCSSSMRTTTTREEGEETQSLLPSSSSSSSSSSSTTTTKKRNSYYYYVALGVVASAGILGMSSSSSAAPRGGSTGTPVLGKDRPTIRLSVGCTPEDVLSLLPFEPKSWRGKVGAKFVTANLSPNFSYENAIDMPEETCGVFAVPHELAHDARYGFFLYEKANPENFVSDIGVQPKGGYADIEVIEEESPAVTTLTRPVSKKEAKKREKEKEMKVKKGEFEDGTKMTPTQKEFFEKKATLASKESKSSSSKSSSSKHAKKADDVEKDKVTKKSSSSSSSSSSKKETAEEKMIRLQQEKIDLLEKEVEETKEANAEKEAKQNEEAEREKEQLEHEEFLKQEKKELEKAKKLAKEKKNVGAFFDWGWWSSSLFHAEEEQSKEGTTIKSRRALLSSAHKPVQKLAVPSMGNSKKTSTAKVPAEQQKKIEKHDGEVSMIKNAKKHHKNVEISSENPIEEEVARARSEYPVQFISSMSSCNIKHELEDTEYYPRHGVANPMGHNVFVFGACRSDLPQCGNPAQKHPGNCQVPKPDDDTFKLAVKACLDEDPVEGNCHKFAKQSEFGVMSMWDVSEVTDMSEAFVDQERFNGDLSQWDTRSVKYFDRMFSGAASFDGDISAWRYASKKTDNHMFAGATAFKASWECGFRPSGLIDFHSCTSSKAMDDIINGRGTTSTSTSKKSTTSSSLINSKEASVGSKEAGVLTDANIMDVVTDCLLAEPVHGDCHGQAFGPISTWDVSRVTNMDQLFMDPPKSIEGDRHSTFNGDLSYWDVSSVTSMIRMFNRANAFNGDLSRWDVSKVQSFSGMFKHTDRFNGDISNWNMQSAKSVDEMFMMALRFNQDISKWSLPNCRNYDRMFEFTGENGFAQDISNWNMREGTHQDMFRDAFAFQRKFTCLDPAHGPAHTCRPNAGAKATSLTAKRQPAVAATQIATTIPTKFVPESEYDRVIDLDA